MKYNFYFVHGWGFDKSFWFKVGYLFANHPSVNSIKFIDLSFFSNDDSIIKNYDQTNNIFIVHSYGLFWFLKNKIKCKVLINFFAAPSFIKFQKNSIKKKKILSKMIYEFKSSPIKVLENFYKNCGVKSPLSTSKLNKEKLLQSLYELLDSDFEITFRELDCKIYSIFSLSDEIFSPSEKIIKKLHSKKHSIDFFDNFEHGMPYINAGQSYEIISKFLDKI